MVISRAGNRRRNYFVLKRFQTKFMLRFCLPVIFTALVAAVVVYYFSSRSTVTVFENSRLIIKPGTEFIIPGLALSTLISVVLVGIATMIIMLFVSHRIAGPLYKIENSLERMGEGDVSFDVHFRRRDEIKDIAESFNRASRRLNDTFSDIKEKSNQLNSIISDLKALAEKSPAEQQVLKEAVKKLEDANSQLNEKLLRFRLR